MTTINALQFISSLTAASVLFGMGGLQVNAQENGPTAEEIINELTSMKPVLACEVFEAHRYNNSANFLGELRKDLCEPYSKNHGWNVFGTAIGRIRKTDRLVDEFNDLIIKKMNALTNNQRQSLVDSFKNIKELQIRDINMPAPNVAEKNLTIEGDDLKILSFMPELKTLKIMGNHKAGGWFGSDAKYDLERINNLELPQIDNVYIDKNDKLTRVSISQLDAERLVISDKNETQFKAIKSNFGNTGRHYGNNQLKNIILGEKVKVSNLYIGNSNNLGTINYSLESDTVEKIFINTESSSLKEITIPSVNELHIWKTEDVKADGTIKSTCHTLERNPNVFRNHLNQFSIVGRCVHPLIKAQKEFQAHLNNLDAIKEASEKADEIVKVESKKVTPDFPETLARFSNKITIEINKMEEWKKIKSQEEREKMKKEVIEKAENFVETEYNKRNRIGAEALEEWNKTFNTCDNMSSYIAQGIAAAGSKLKVKVMGVKIPITPFSEEILEELSSECKKRIIETIKKKIDGAKVTIKDAAVSIRPFSDSSDDGYIPLRIEGVDPEIPRDMEVSTKEEPRKINNPQVSTDTEAPTEEDLKKSLEELAKIGVEVNHRYPRSDLWLTSWWGWYFSDAFNPDKKNKHVYAPSHRWLGDASETQNLKQAKAVIKYVAKYAAYLAKDPDFPKYAAEHTERMKDPEEARIAATYGLSVNGSPISLDISDVNAFVKEYLKAYVSFRDSETRGNYGGALSYAIYNNDVEMARILIEAGADPYERKPNWDPPINQASGMGIFGLDNTEMMELLRSYRPR